MKTVNRLNATIKCTGESAFHAYWISQSRKPIASIDFRDFFQKIQYARKLVRTRSELYELPEDLLCYLSSAFWEKKNLVNVLNYVFHGWVDGRCMYFSIFWTIEGDMLLWTTNPVAACKDTFSIFWINLFVKIRLSAASNSSGFHSKKKSTPCVSKSLRSVQKRAAMIASLSC